MTATDPEAPSNQRTCGTCGEFSPLDANWCEACGADLDAVPAATPLPCVSCGAAAVEVTSDGWCQICGTKQPAPGDHVVADHGWFAIVSDKGQVHRTNEDAGSVAALSPGVALVVCDGVSSTDESQHAAQAAAKAVVDAVQEPSHAEAEQAITSGARLAQSAIVAVTPAEASEPPSCTMVTAIAQIEGAHADLVIGWLGDSRAYWIGPDSAEQLTRDHSWAIEQEDLGELDAAAIAADPRAHSITRWLGADSHDATPEIRSLRVHLPGLLLVCSDGLWNYAPTEQEVFALAAGDGSHETPLQQAERLVAFANERGGHDNITVAVASLEPASTTHPPRTPRPEH